MDEDEKTNIENEFVILRNLINSGTANYSGSSTEQNDLIKIWLIASITKNLKYQTDLNSLFSGF